MNGHRFPIGAWVVDRDRARWTGDIEHGNNGGVHFSPSAGEIVSLLTHRLGAAYRIRFASIDTVVFADAVVCRECGSPDDDPHEDWCQGAPGGLYRVAAREPGYAPEMADIRAREAARRQNREATQ